MTGTGLSSQDKSEQDTATRESSIAPQRESDNARKIKVLHVDDEADFLELTAEIVQRENDQITWQTQSNPIEAINWIRCHEIDCIVSDFDMPQMDGLSFLTAVRREHPDLPFVLFTGKGSEEIASEAIQAGVTDYLQKGGGLDQYAVLENRVNNAVRQYWAMREVKETQDRFQRLVQHSTDVISIVDPNGRWQYLTPSSERILGHHPDDLVGEIGFNFVHPDDREQAMATFATAVANPEMIPETEFRFDHPSKGWIWTHSYARNMLDDPLIQGFIVHTRDITDRKQHELELQRQNKRLDEFTSIVSHDLRNPLSTIKGYLALLDEEYVADYLPKISQNLDRMEAIIDRSLTLARSGRTIAEFDAVDLGDVVRKCTRRVKSERATIDVPSDIILQGNEEQLEILIENLLQNAIDHVGENVHVRFGRLSDGFFIEDNGTGFPANIDRVFESGYSTTADGFGFGLTICQRIVDAHGWEIQGTESDQGGARIEITAVKMIEA